jgi:hypothetical protein
LAVWYKPLAGHRFLGLPAVTGVEGLELFPQVSRGETSFMGSGLKPMRTGYKQGEMQLIAFTCRLRWAQPLATKQGKAEQLHPLSCVQRSRNEGSFCYNVMPLLWLHPVCCYRRSLKEEEGLLGFCLLRLYFGLFGPLAFLLGFCLFALGGFLPFNIGKKLLLWAF